MSDNRKNIYFSKINDEFLFLLQKLKNPFLDKKERSKYVIRVMQILDIYRNNHDDEFADILVNAYKNAQLVYDYKKSNFREVQEFDDNFDDMDIYELINDNDMDNSKHR